MSLLQCSYFDSPCISECGDKLIRDISIERLSELDLERYEKQRKIVHKPWFQVRIITSSLKGWLFYTQKQLPDTDATKSVPAYQTGAPGRPTSMHLIRKEFDDRYDRGDSAATITEEAAALAKWLKASHPEAAPATPKAIRNRLAKPFRSRLCPAQK